MQRFSKINKSVFNTIVNSREILLIQINRISAAFNLSLYFASVLFWMQVFFIVFGRKSVEFCFAQ